MPDDRDAERGMVGRRIVGAHCSDLASRLPQTPFPLVTLGVSAFEQRAGNGPTRPAGRLALEDWKT
jgi:hypothetical protein